MKQKKTCPSKYCLSASIICDGFYKRSGDAKKIQRFRCKSCGRRFSCSTNQLSFRQKKRRENPMIFKLLNSNVSMRRCAKILNLSRGTIERRLKYFAKRERKKHENLLKKYPFSQVHELQIDDLITKENSKLKPLSVSLAVDGKKRIILSAKVSQIPAFGHLSKHAKKKYGKRRCFHRNGLGEMCEEIKQVIAPDALIKSDEHHKYPEFVAQYFPKAKYLRFKAERSCIAGQGELKRVKFDPLFAINHTCALLRANICRLIRKTWCTTKDPQRLQDHIDIFISFHNRMILKDNTT